jgi:hypothetical protein
VVSDRKPIRRTCCSLRQTIGNNSFHSVNQPGYRSIIPFEFPSTIGMRRVFSSSGAFLYQCAFKSVNRTPPRRGVTRRVSPIFLFDCEWVYVHSAGFFTSETRITPLSFAPQSDDYRHTVRTVVEQWGSIALLDHNDEFFSLYFSILVVYSWQKAFGGNPWS